MSKTFNRRGASWRALDGLNLSLPAGTTCAVVGESGSGKTTLLRILAGLLEPDQGFVSYRQGDQRWAPREARVGMMFQEPRLLPWLTVWENVALATRGALGDLPTADGLKPRIDDLLATLGLAPWAQARPHQLSGGMAQRVALGRTLVTDPALLLMDEPFSALDWLTRRRLQQEFLAVTGTSGRTVVLVTHDLTEALFLADTVVILHQGRLVAQESNPRKGRQEDLEHPSVSSLLKYLGGSL